MKLKARHRVVADHVPIREARENAIATGIRFERACLTFWNDVANEHSAERRDQSEAE